MEKSSKKKITISAVAVGLIATTAVFLNFTSNFDCTNFTQTQIPASQCEALIDLYDATNGDNWTHNTNWLSEQPVSQWVGVTVVDHNVTDLYLYDNNLSGEIPESIGNLSELTRLGLGNNNLSGEIPETIGNLSELEDLKLHNNNLSGEIPESIGNLSELEDLKLHNNDLSGEIPESIGNLSELKYLMLYGNDLSGEIPESIDNLSELEYLNLGVNSLSGEIPESIGNLSELEYLGLGNNNLSGEIPETIGNLSGLYYLNLQYNNLSGNIPDSIGNLSELESLNLSNNNLGGEIPHLGNMPSLMYVYLSSNKFQGNLTPEMIAQNTDTWYVYNVTGNCLNDLSGSFIGWFLDQPDLITDGFYFYEQGTLEHCSFEPASTDINGDGVVNNADLLLFLGMFGTYNPAGDFDGDGIVGVSDQLILMGAFNTVSSTNNVTSNRASSEAEDDSNLPVESGDSNELQSLVKSIIDNGGRFDKQGNRIPSRTEKQMLPREFFTKTPPKDKLELDVKEYMPELDVKADSRVMKKVAPKKSEKR